MSETIRVAAVQFGTGSDVSANLAKCLQMIDQAAAENPDLMVLPEFVNHLSWYDDKAHCYNVSVPLDGEFLAAVPPKRKNTTVTSPSTALYNGKMKQPLAPFCCMGLMVHCSPPQTNKC